MGPQLCALPWPISAGRGVGWSWCPSSCRGHSPGTAALSTMPAGGWLLCTGAALPGCIHVPLCAGVHPCACVYACICVHASAPRIRVRCVPLCICVHACACVYRVPTCICPVHPYAWGHLHWPLQQSLLPGLAWGSALRTALGGSSGGSCRLIPSRCGCWEPGSASPPRRGPRRFLVRGCWSRWSRQSSRLPGSCIAAGLFTARSSRLCSSAAAILPSVSAPACTDPGAVSDQAPAPGRDGAGGPALPLPASPHSSQCAGDTGDTGTGPVSPAALPGPWEQCDTSRQAPGAQGSCMASLGCTPTCCPSTLAVTTVSLSCQPMRPQSRPSGRPSCPQALLGKPPPCGGCMGGHGALAGMEARLLRG